MQKFIDRLLNNGAVILNPQALVEFRVPQIPTRVWEPGCLIYICFGDLVLADTICTSDGMERQIPFIPVTVKFPDGEHQEDKLFLSQLTKIALPVDGGHRVVAKGTASNFVRNCTNWSEAFEGLKDKVLKISEDHYVEVRGIDPESTRFTHVYCFDFA